MKRLALFVVLGFSLTQALFGQSNSKDDINPKWWGNIGEGIGGGSKVLGPAFGISLNYLYVQNLYSARYLNFQNTPIGFLGNDPNELSPVRNIIEGAVLYGRCEKKSDHLIAGSVGIGFLQRQNNELSGGEIKTAFGVAFQAQAFWNPSPYWGIGINGFANINKEKTLLGLLLCLQVGNL